MSGAARCARSPRGWQHLKDAGGRYVPLLDADYWSDEPVNPAQKMPSTYGLRDDETEIAAYEATTEGTPISPAFPNTREARLLYDLLLPYAGRNIVTGSPAFCSGSASRPLGMMAAVIGRYDDAERHFEDALASDQNMNARPWVAHDQYRYARMLLARGGSYDRAEARGVAAGGTFNAAEELGMKKPR